MKESSQKQNSEVIAISFGEYEAQEKLRKSLRTLPMEQKITRALIAQTPSIQRSLFDALEKAEADNEGNIVYSNLPSLISDYDFRTYIFAAKTILFDQSYLFNNEDKLSGYIQEQSNITTTDGLRDEKEKPYYNGNICVTLNDLCRVAYGIPEDQTPLTSQRNNMRKAIEVVDKTPIGIVYANGDERETYLVKLMAKYKRKSDGAESYHLILNPIFTTMAKGYGIVLRGVTARLSQYFASKGKTGRGCKSAALYAFMELLSIQDLKKGVWNISLENLLHNLNLREMFRKNKKRATEKLEEIFEAFVATGLLLEAPSPTIPTDGVYHFKLNPNPKSNFLPTNPSTDTSTPT